MSSSIQKLQQLGALAPGYEPTTAEELDTETPPLSPGLQKLEKLGALASPVPKPKPTIQAEPSTVDEIKLGIKESFAPFSLTEKEAKQEPTVTRSLVNLASDIGQSVAAGAVGGMVAGPVGAVVAGVGAGVYRALGLESVKAKAEDRDMDPAKAGVNLVTELLPALKTGKTLTRVAASAAQGTAQFAQAKQYGASGEMAALVGVLGGGLTYAARTVTDKLPTVTPDDVNAVGAGALVTQNLKAQGLAQDGIVSVLSDRKTSVNLQESYLNYLSKNEQAENAIVDVLTKATQEGKKLKGFVELDDKTLDAIRTHEQFDIVKQSILDSPAKRGWVNRNHDKIDNYVASLILREAQTDIKVDIEDVAKQARSLRDVVVSQRASALMAKEFKKIAEDLDDPLLGKDILSKFGADYFVARLIDDATGLGIRTRLDNLAMAETNHRVVVNGWDRRVNKITHKLGKLKVDRKDIGVALELDDEARDAFLRTKYSTKQVNEMTPVLAEIRTMFDNIRAFAANNGVEIPYRKNYVTSLPQEVGAIAKNMAQAYRQVFGNVTPGTKLSDVLKDLPSDKQEMFKQLYQSAERILDKVPQTVKDIQRSFLKLKDPEFLKQNIGFELSAAYARTGEIPELIRERDIATILKYYGRNVSRAVHLTPQLKELQTLGDVLKVGGFNRSAEWLDNYLKGVSGAPGKLDVALQVTKTKARIAAAMLTENDPMLKKLGARVPEFAVDLITYIPKNLYAAYLGGDIGPLVTNMTQNLFVTAPEIGGKFGTKYVAKGFLRLAKHIGQSKSPEDYVANYFNPTDLPPQFAAKWKNKKAVTTTMSVRDSAIQVDAFREGVKGTDAYDNAKGLVTNVADVVNGVGLWLYNKSDSINRFVTIEAGKELTKDYIAGKKHALEFVKKADKSLQNDLLEIRKFGGSQEQRAKLTEYAINTYLVSKTQFFYTKSQSFQFGREWGSLVTQFTKFPTMIGSDLTEGFYRGGLKGGTTKLVTKYLTPLIIAKGILDITTDDEQTEREKILRLNSALRSSPITSVIDINPPPVLAIGGKTAKAFVNVLDEDFETAVDKMGRVLTREVMPALLPGTWIPKAYKKTYSFITNEPFPEED